MKLVRIYADTRGVSLCSGPTCGRRILWAQVVATGKKMCFDDLDLVAIRTEQDNAGRLIEHVDLDRNHWATCPDAKRFERKPKPIERPTGGKCYIPYCEREIPLTYLMCPAHWAKVPKKLQADVWKWYRVRQNGGSALNESGRKYLLAIEAARQAVEEKENGPLYS